MRVSAATGFGPLASERREKLGLTQAQLAERAGVTRDWVVRFEAGSHSVTLYRVMRVLRALDLEVDIEPIERSTS